MARLTPEKQSQPRLSIILFVLFHLVVICGLIIVGLYLGDILLAIVMQPVTPGDLMSEWWQIFRKLAATLVGGLFLGLLIGYVLLIWPGE